MTECSVNKENTMMDASIFDNAPLATSSPTNEEESLSLEQIEEIGRQMKAEIEMKYNSVIEKLRSDYKDKFIPQFSKDMLCSRADDALVKSLRDQCSRLLRKKNGEPDLSEEVDKENQEKPEDSKLKNTSGSKVKFSRGTLLSPIIEDDQDGGVFKAPKDIGNKKKSRNVSSRKFSEKASSLATPIQSSRSRGGYAVAAVTPGPNSTRPLHILRRPNPGELAISLSGSPLHVAHENLPLGVPQVTIPLQDGRMMTVIADEELDLDSSICSKVDDITKERLTILQKFIGNVRR